MADKFPKFLGNHPIREFVSFGGCARKSSATFFACGGGGQKSFTWVWKG
jgi:hypothetical protein